jgi:hypothetical protein
MVLVRLAICWTSCQLAGVTARETLPLPDDWP